jgi:outer membrane protein OmpA-like peptidoglycan-associated protein
LNILLEYLQNNTDKTIQISGHTDNTGKETDNLLLSENRAKAVADFLISKGIAKNRITTNGYGSSKPIADNNTEDGKQRNRRVEFVVK